MSWCFRSRLVNVVESHVDAGDQVAEAQRAVQVRRDVVEHGGQIEHHERRAVHLLAQQSVGQRPAVRRRQEGVHVAGRPVARVRIEGQQLQVGETRAATVIAAAAAPAAPALSSSSSAAAVATDAPAAPTATTTAAAVAVVAIEPENGHWVVRLQTLDRFLRLPLGLAHTSNLLGATGVRYRSGAGHRTDRGLVVAAAAAAVVVVAVGGSGGGVVDQW